MSYSAKLMVAKLATPTATHDQIDMMAKSYGGKAMWRRSLFKNGGIKTRRAYFISWLDRRLVIEKKAIAYNAERAAFIGPRTTRDANGHPF